MAKGKTPPMLGSTGHYDYDEMCDFYPLGGWNGRETADGLEDRNPRERPTEVENAEGFTRGPSHHNRTRLPDEPARSIREPTVEDGVTFRRPMRSDLDDDVFCS